MHEIKWLQIKLPLKSEVIFNGILINHIIIEPSAQEHYENESTNIFVYIASTLNGQNREPDEISSDDPKKNVYKIASCVAMDDVPKISDYRDTCFRLDQERGGLKFFHGSSRREKQYEKKPQKQKERIE